MTDFDDEKNFFISTIIITVVYYIYIKVSLTLGKKEREALN